MSFASSCINTLWLVVICRLPFPEMVDSNTKKKQQMTMFLRLSSHASIFCDSYLRLPTTTTLAGYSMSRLSSGYGSKHPKMYHTKQPCEIHVRKLHDCIFGSIWKPVTIRNLEQSQSLLARIQQCGAKLRFLLAWEHFNAFFSKNICGKASFVPRLPSEGC